MIKKMIVAMIVLTSCLFASGTFVYGNESWYTALQIENINAIRVKGNDIRLNWIDPNDSSMKPFIHEGSAMLPLRAFGSIIPVDGFTYLVEWHEIERKAVLIESSYRGLIPVAEFWIGSTTAVYYDRDGRNPRRITIPNAPMIVNDRIYIPLRAAVDALWHHSIEWVPSKQGIVIYWTIRRPQYVTFPDMSSTAF